jgi:hypothetical protein
MILEIFAVHLLFPTYVAVSNEILFGTVSAGGE